MIREGSGWRRFDTSDLSPDRAGKDDAIQKHTQVSAYLDRKQREQIWKKLTTSPDTTAVASSALHDTTEVQFGQLMARLTEDKHFLRAVKSGDLSAHAAHSIRAQMMAMGHFRRLDEDKLSLLIHAFFRRARSEFLASAETKAVAHHRADPVAHPQTSS